MASSAFLKILLAGALLAVPTLALGEETVVISGARVRLVDILPDAPGTLANSDLGPAPPPGRSRYLDPEEIASRLKAQGISASSLKVPRGVRVESAGHLFTPAELMRLVAGPLSAAMPEGATLIEHSVTSEHLLSPAVSVGAVHLPELVRGRDLVSQTVTVELVSGGAPVLRLPVRIKVKVGAALREAFVERGASVTLSIVRGQVEVSAMGETLRAGKVGEAVAVRVLATNKIVTAKLVLGSSPLGDEVMSERSGNLWLQALTLILLFGASGCYRNTIKEPKPRQRDYDTGEYAATEERNRPAVGSVYSEAQSSYFQDTRALRVGDIVMIRIEEHADARGGASTSLSRSSDRESGVKEFMGLVEVLQAQAPGVDPSTLWKLVSDYEFNGSGKTSRAGSLSGSIGVRVKKEMPNGDLYIEGTKIVMINHEEYHLYISGVVRPADILEDNSVDSSLVADARVEFTGHGDIEEQTQQGWLGWFLNKINPF